MRGWILGFFVALSSCSSSSDSAPSTPPQTSLPGDEILFSTDDYVIAPGEEKYVCWAHDLPADRNAVIREISGDYGPATHHVFFAWTLAPEPEGEHECPVLFKTTWIPVYLGGKNTSPLSLPDGAAIDLGRGKQMVLQLHMQNVTAAPITNRVTMHMKLRDGDAGFEPAGIFGLDDRDILLPPNTADVQSSMSCKPGKDMNVFAVLGHMHKLGKQLSVSKNDSVVYDEKWNFDEQPITPFQMTVGQSDSVGIACTHSNTLNQAVTYGESSDQEMCATILYYTPYDHLAGCINVPHVDAGPPPSSDGGP